MKQMARNVTMERCGALGDSLYLLHDRDTKYTASFLAIIKSGDVKTLRLPARSPNLNAYSERWVRSAKEECLSKLVLFGERSLRRAMREYVVHYQAERNHQGKSNILFPQVTEIRCEKAANGVLAVPSSGAQRLVVRLARFSQLRARHSVTASSI